MTTGRYILNCIVEQVPQLSPADALEIANELLDYVVWCDEKPEEIGTVDITTYRDHGPKEELVRESGNYLINVADVEIDAEPPATGNYWLDAVATEAIAK